MSATKSILVSALSLHREGKFEDAEKLYRKVLRLNPKDDMALYFLSLITRSSERTEESIQLVKKAALIKPTFEYYNDLGGLYFADKQFQNAINSLESALAISKGNEDIKGCLAQAYFARAEELNKENINEALLYYQKALSAKPQFPDACFKLGRIYQVLGDNKNAIEYYNRTLELAPNTASVYYNLGNVFLSMYDYDKAIYYYEKVISIDSSHNDALNNLAKALYENKEIERSIEAYKELLSREPDSAFVKFNLACAYMRNKNFIEGWPLYQNRFFMDYERRPILKEFSKPLWNGCDIKGKTLYVYHEQGLGDTIEFSRYIPVLKSMGANVLFRPQKPLEALFRINTFGAEIIPESVTDDELEFDFHTPLLSVGQYLGINYNNVIVDDKYLVSSPEKVEYYRKNYFANKEFKVGIVWQCGVKDCNRTVALENFYPLADIKGVKLYSIQKGEIGELAQFPGEITDLGSTFNDFSDTAGALENLDLLISADTSVLHLAGALGKPVWVLLPYSTDFRWFLDEDDSIWYKRMRLFRQTEPNNWVRTIGKAIEALKALKVVS